MILFYISMSYILECVYELCYYKCDKLNERSQIMSQLTCTVCHTYFESKRADTKCCSAKCRKKASRAKDSVGPAEIVVVDTGGMPKGLSETDRLFYLDTLHMGPEWMKFSEESEVLTGRTLATSVIPSSPIPLLLKLTSLSKGH